MTGLSAQFGHWRTAHVRGNGWLKGDDVLGGFGTRSVTVVREDRVLYGALVEVL